jgi:RNA polymerase sigma-70 factor (ECF subfamily)
MVLGRRATLLGSSEAKSGNPTSEDELSQEPNRTEESLVARLRSGDELAFAALVDGLHCRLLALAKTFTSSASLAEDIVQETWLAVIRGLRGFEDRSTLRTWIFSILVRRAKTLAVREARWAKVSIPQENPGNGEPSFEWEPGRGRLGLWDERPVPWGLEDPAAVFQMRETLEVVENAVAKLPEMQRQVVFLRDVEDVSPADVCNILDISETNQRVLLHRGRARVRRALDQYLRDGAERPVRSGASTTRATDGHSESSVRSLRQGRGT